MIQAATSVVAVVALLLLTGCAAGVTSRDDPAAALDGDWALTGGIVDGRQLELVPGYPVTLSRDEDGVVQLGACNTYGAEAEADGAGIEITLRDGTLMRCGGRVGALADAFLAGLGRVDRAVRDDGTLSLTGPDVRLVYAALPPPAPADLLDIRWQLEGLVDGDVTAPHASVSSAAGEPATLRVSSDGRLAATTGCRRLTGRWVEFIAHGTLTRSESPGSCPDALVPQDGTVYGALSQFRATVDGDRLLVQGRVGAGLVYRRAP